MLNIFLYILVGLIGGTLSGLLGIGGAVFMIPAISFLFGFSQHLAQGTTLAIMVPPIGLLAAYTYFKQGYVDLKMAAFIAIAFFIGGFIGARIALVIPAAILKRMFGVLLVFIGVKLLLGK